MSRKVFVQSLEDPDKIIEVEPVHFNNVLYNQGWVLVTHEDMKNAVPYETPIWDKFAEKIR